MKTAQNEAQPAVVLERAKQAGETNPKEWDWVEHSVWTERMLEALVRGVKGGVWFSLIDRIKLHGISRGHDHFRWPNEFFRVHGLYSLVEAHRTLLQSSSR